MEAERSPEASDLELGTRQARAAALLALSLPGTVYIYQGGELGLWEVEDIPDELLQDPFWQRSRQTDRGRDGCRVPLPWSGEQPPFGFTADGARPWLPQPEGWKGGVVAAIGIRIPADLGRRRTESSRHPCAHCALDAPPLGEKN